MATPSLNQWEHSLVNINMFTCMADLNVVNIAKKYIHSLVILYVYTNTWSMVGVIGNLMGTPSLIQWENSLVNI